jgi:hypothetical protein
LDNLWTGVCICITRAELTLLVVTPTINLASGDNRTRMIGARIEAYNLTGDTGYGNGLGRIDGCAIAELTVRVLSPAAYGT